MRLESVLLWMRITLIQGILLTIFTLFLIRVTGHFTVLHPDAYRDGLRSVLGIYLLLRTGLGLAGKWSPAVRERFLWRRSDGNPVRTYVTSVCLVFTGITIVNSIMMLTGTDTPKTGPFAYAHILIRLGIVSVTAAIWMGRDLWNALVRQGLKEVPRGQGDSPASSPGLMSVREFSVWYTGLVAVLCLLALLPRGPLSPEGGRTFYLILLLAGIPAALFVLGNRTLIRREGNLGK